MAVTRINNNQITTAVNGNAYLGINAAAKLQNYSITSNKIANSLVYGSDLTISGNLTVNGTTTTIDTVNTLIQDPIITLADGQTAGTPSVDIGVIGLRGSENSSFLGWKESQTEFVAALSNTTVSNTTANITSYANFHANTITADGNLSVAGNITGSANFTGNITAGNILTPGLISATGNLTSGNVLTGGIVSASGDISGNNLYGQGEVSTVGNVVGGNVNTVGLITATGNITGGNLLTGGLISATGNVTGGNINFGSGIVSGTGNIYADTIFANISGNIDAAGSNTEIQFNTTGDILGANANFTYNYATNLMTVNGGNINTGNLSATGQVIADANITGGNLLTGGEVSATANVTGGNILTAGLISATGNITGGNVISLDLVQGVTVSASGNTISGNVNTTGVVTATGNVTGGNILTAGLVSATGNATAGNIDTAGLITATGNVTGGNILTAGLISATGNATAGNIDTAGLITATGNVTGGNILTAGLISAGGNITSATNVNTPNVVATGNLELFGGNILLTPTSNIVVNNTYINGVAQPVQSNDVATKIYVDNMVSTQIAYHPAVFAATTANLATTTGGTITYNQPNGAGNGVGATLTVAGGTFNLIDTANVQTVGTRILVKNEGNAAFNGAYVWSNATVLTRSTDADQYGPNSSEELSINDYFFVQNGDVNKGSAYIVDAPAGEIIFGTSNISFAQFSSSQTYTGGNGISLYGTVISTVYDNSTIGINGSNQLYIPANAPLVTPNIGAATGTSLSVTGAITAGTDLSAVANVIAGNVTTTGVVSATGNVTGGNILTAGLISATGNITTADALNGGTLSLSGNVTSPLNVTGNIAGGNITTPGLFSATGNVTGGNILTSGIVSATANVTGGNLLTSGEVSATSNITGGNILTSGIISSTGNISTGANLIVSGYETVTGNITGGNILTAGVVSATGNGTFGNIDTVYISASGNIDTSANINQTGTGNINGYDGYFSNSLSVLANLYITGNVVAVQAGIFYGNSVTGNGAVYAGLPSYTPLGSNVVAQFSGNANSYSQINFQNISNGTSASTDYIATADNGTDTSYYVDLGINSSTFNDPIDYPGFGPNDAYVHNHGGNLILNPETTGKAINFMVGGTDTTDVIGYIDVDGLFVNGGAGNITSPNVIGTTSGIFGNIIISGDNITDTNGRVNVNDALGDVDFAVNGGTANLLYIDAGTNTASFGSSAQTTNAIVAFNADTSILLPVGNTGVRPSNASSVTGMFRFNTTLNSLEVYDNSGWIPVGSTIFTVIADEQFNGDGTTVNFTLGSTQTTNSCIVSINGIVQIPGTAYSVSGTNPSCVLTFTEAPSEGDLIDVREVTTTTTVTSISNSSGNSVLAGSPTSAEMTLTGNLIPIGANISQTLGNSTNAWKSLYVSGSTIYLGNIQLKQAAGNTFAVYQSDGTTPANITGVDATSIQNGASNVTIGTANSNISVSVNGTSVVTFTSSGIINNMGNGVGNIGNSTGYFNTVFAKATSAQYADLAEKYVADAEYAPGTVVSFGGEKEVTKSSKDGDRAVAGVVSTNPSYIMNATLEAEHVAVVAFTGRVPTSVTGTVAKGDLMVSNGDGTARAEADPKAGAIIGKALENFAGGSGIIEVVIGRF